MILIDINMPSCCSNCPFLQFGQSDNKKIDCYCAASKQFLNNFNTLNQYRNQHCPIIKEVEKNKWKYMGRLWFDEWWQCSNCKNEFQWRYKFCPNCGAAMEMEE